MLLKSFLIPTLLATLALATPSPRGGSGGGGGGRGGGGRSRSGSSRNSIWGSSSSNSEKKVHYGYVVKILVKPDGTHTTTTSTTTTTGYTGFAKPTWTMSPEQVQREEKQKKADAEKKAKDKKTTMYIIIGASVGGALLASLVAFLAWKKWKSKRGMKKVSQTEEGSEANLAGAGTEQRSGSPPPYHTGGEGTGAPAMTEVETAYNGYYAPGATDTASANYDTPQWQDSTGNGTAAQQQGDVGQGPYGPTSHGQPGEREEKERRGLLENSH